MTSLVEEVDDRFAGIDIDSLLNGQRRPLSFERKKALYEAPEFIQRLSGEETVLEGQSLCIECKVRGFPVPWLRWFKDDEEILDHPRIHVETDGIGGYYLIIDYVTREDEAAYRCRAENVEGACSSFFFLSVKGKPKRRDAMPSWRTVSFPPMFSTIVEKVEEEEEQGREFAELPPSPLTEFYYALTLKSRCSWPAFLGDWAFANRNIAFNRNYSNSDDDEDVVGTEEDDEDDNDSFDAFLIANGDICDKLKSYNSNKALFTSKRSCRKNAIPARSKKHNFGDKQNKLTEDGNNKRHGSDIKERNEKNTKVAGNEMVMNATKETAILQDNEIVNKLQTRNGDIRDTKNDDVTMPSVTFYKDGKDADKTQSREYQCSQEISSTEEIRDNTKLNQNMIETGDFVSLSSCKEDKKGLLNKDMKQVSEKHQIGNDENSKKQQHIFITGLASNKLEEDSSEFNREILSSRISGKSDVVCLHEIKDRQNNADYREINIKTTFGTSPLPESLRVFKLDGNENAFGNKEKENHQNGWRQSVTKDKSPLRHNETEAQQITTLEKVHTSNEKLANNTTDNKYLTKLDSPVDSYKCSPYKHSSVGDHSRYHQIRHSSPRDGRVQQTQVRGIDRLEELRLQEIQRMEELKQEELKRMEELRQEGRKFNGCIYTKAKFTHGDFRDREKKQIEELRRKEQMQRGELQQKEQQQLEDLRRKGGYLSEDMKFKEDTFSNLPSPYQQDQIDEWLIREREELRLREHNQMEELKQKESLQKDELILKEYMQKEDRRTYERHLTEEIKVKDGSYFEHFNKQTVFELQKEEDEAEEREREERKNMKEREMRIHMKKEQLRREQLRRQHEEGILRHQKKQEEIRKISMMKQDINRDSMFLNKPNRRFLSVRENNVETSRDKLYGMSVSNNVETSRDKLYGMSVSNNVETSRDKLYGMSVSNNVETSRDKLYGMSVSKNVEISRDKLYGMSVSNNVETSRDNLYGMSVSNMNTIPRLAFRTKNRERDDLSLTKMTNSDILLRESFTNSLGRPFRKTSELSTNATSNDQLNKFRSFTDNNECMKTEITKVQNDTRCTNNTSGYRHPEGAWHSHNSYASSSQSDKNLQRLDQAEIQKPLSFASVFAIEESRVAKPSCRSHEDFLKLAESIASNRERFHEYLSHYSVKDDESPVLTATDRKASVTNRKAEDRYEAYIHKQNSHDPVRKADTRSLHEPDTQGVETNPDHPEKIGVSLSPLTKQAKDERSCDRSHAIEPRPFMHNSARTTARRFYKKE